METKIILQRAAELRASDLFIIAGRPLSYRKNEQLLTEEGERLMTEDTARMIQDIYALAGGRDMDELLQTGDDDFSFALPGICRFRVNAYKQRGSLAAVIRVIRFSLPTPEEMHIPSSIIELGSLSKGLVLVTGPAGSGKSTTLACIIDHINHTADKHIITLEDPLEYLHRHDK
ncbi:MAG TPA: Flp pilus assembly complex ATPase component TadA, partial [Candidatus Scatomonas merdavium]|nr:Flp pilus assembly complex ATPase component TadA [Candidatus Scatomonas merdavium]